MRIGLAQEGETRPGISTEQRYHEMIEEVQVADRVGFSVYGNSEQHFSPPRFNVAAPEVFCAALATQTERIHLRTMCTVLLQWNHPMLVAERLATLDILSHGRAEAGFARSNNLGTLEAFGVPASETAQQFDESLALLIKILTEEEAEGDGPLWQMPPRTLVPGVVQKPHPPLSMAASSLTSCRKAGRLGIGAMLFEGYFGFEYFEKCVDEYRAGLAEHEPAASQLNESMGIVAIGGFCAETREEAIAVAGEQALGYFAFMGELYGRLASTPGYEYLVEVERVVENIGKIDYLLKETPSVIIGTPDDFIARFQELSERGVDEVVIRVDGLPTEKIKSCLELIGREVIPRFDPLVATA
ncbi:MAG: LLM class flavin-dependent oxidoreductase [Solirubrobacterales bacterium]